ncbi:mothers against decapentaplegic homolog [Plakobranchus ocellatus]|uniref:Mothers against decapentaplegic homolog n=1 Tax=Plakobranchus ocellatus TaxID=259542 RepID=A0AAV3ZT93_9GAST|nr:mothers against decapentaplegic homolog [Plakobranchus ocellatus]
MFRSKRSSLVKRLWKYKLNDEAWSALQDNSQEEASVSMSSPAVSPPPSTSSSSFRPRSIHFWSSSPSSTTLSPSSPPPSDGLDIKSVAHSFFKRLKEDQLENLLRAMESRGGEVTPCVQVSKSELRVSGGLKGQGSAPVMVPPHVLCCRVFRWPGLKNNAELKRLPSCDGGGGGDGIEKDGGGGSRNNMICCNPYHWSIVVKTDERPISADKLIPRLRSSSRRSAKADQFRIINTKSSGLSLPIPNYSDCESALRSAGDPSVAGSCPATDTLA